MTHPSSGPPHQPTSPSDPTGPPWPAGSPYPSGPSDPSGQPYPPPGSGYPPGGAGHPYPGPGPHPAQPAPRVLPGFDVPGPAAAPPGTGYPSASGAGHPSTSGPAYPPGSGYPTPPGSAPGGPPTSFGPGGQRPAAFGSPGQPPSGYRPPVAPPKRTGRLVLLLVGALVLVLLAGGGAFAGYTYVWVPKQKAEHRLTLATTMGVPEDFASQQVFNDESYRTSYVMLCDGGRCPGDVVESLHEWLGRGGMTTMSREDLGKCLADAQQLGLWCTLRWTWQGCQMYANTRGVEKWAARPNDRRVDVEFQITACDP